MTGFVVDTSSLSYDEIRADIVNFIDTRPDAAKWRDFFASGSGQTLIELLSGISAFLGYDIITARRETFLPYVNLRSSAIAGSQTLGYSSFRGRNPVLNITFTPTSTNSFNRFDIIGSIKDRDLILDHDLVINTGVSTVARVIVGNLKEDEVTVQSANPSSFRFSTPNVSSDVRVFLRGDLVSTSERILDLINEKFVVQSNTLGAVDVLYLNLSTFVNRYRTGDLLKIQWVELRETTIASTDIKLDYGDVDSYEFYSVYQPVESLSSIQINAPLYHETQFVIRGRSDYAKIFKLLDSSITYTTYKDITPAIVELSYMRTDLSLFYIGEKNNIIYQLLTYRPMGLEPPLIADPNPVFMKFLVDIKQKTSVLDPIPQVDAVIQSLARKFPDNVTIDLEQLENDIETLDFVKIARVTIGSVERKNLTKYRRGACVTPVTPNGYTYINQGRTFKSGSSEPVWNSTVGQTTIDGDYRWKCYVLSSPTYPTWTPNTEFSFGDLIRPIDQTPPLDTRMFICEKRVAYSGQDIASATASRVYSGVTFTAINTGSIGNSINLVFDGVKTIFQVVATWNMAVPSNQVSHNGNNNDVLLPSNFNLQGGIDYESGEPTWIAGDVSATSPEFIEDNQLLWIKAIKKGTPVTWAPHTIYNLGDSISPRAAGSEFDYLMYQCVGYMSISGSAEPVFPLVEGDEISDGTSVWKCSTPTSNPPLLNYNEYYILTDEVTIA